MNAVPQPLKYFRSDGTQLELGSRVGEGGEGKVYYVSGTPDVVAKIHHIESHEERTDREIKLRAIVNKGSSQLRDAAAWPSDLVFDEFGRVSGFTMQMLHGYMPLYMAYQTRVRLRKLPGRTFKFLVRTARNLAACVHFVHSDDMVIGDLNETNTFVSSNAKVRLIDADSFQIEVDGKTMPPNVGKPELLPPELQGKSLDRRIRKRSEDCFSLAVLIFQTLNFGRHPFAGTPRNEAEEIELETAIKHGWYVFSERRHVPLQQPPGLTLSHLPERIRVMFEDAFELNGLRPTAEAWHAALLELEESMIECPHNSVHVYWDGAQKCPWCHLESAWRVPLFQMDIPSQIAGDRIDFGVIRQKVQKEMDSGLHEGLPSLKNYLPLAPKFEKRDSPLQRMTRILSNSKLRPLHLFGIVQVLCLSQFMSASRSVAQNSHLIGAVNAALIFGVAYAAVLIVLLVRYVTRSGLKLTFRGLLSRQQKILEQWKYSANKSLLKDKLDQVDSLKLQFEKLDELYEMMRFESLKTVYRQHVRMHLKKYSLLVASVPDEYRDLISNLYDRGITTAAEVSHQKIRTMTPNTPQLADDLAQWVDELERSFFAASSLALPHAEEASINATMSKVRKDIREKALMIEREVGDLGQSIRRSQADLIQQYEQFAPELAQKVERLNAF